MYTSPSHIFQWKKLAEPEVWLDAATQIFYSFGLAFGCLIALASYNPVRSNFVKEAFFVTVADFFTSIFTATVVFCVLGRCFTSVQLSFVLQTTILYPMSCSSAILHSTIPLCSRHIITQAKSKVYNVIVDILQSYLGIASHKTLE